MPSQKKKNSAKCHVARNTGHISQLGTQLLHRENLSIHSRTHPSRYLQDCRFCLSPFLSSCVLIRLQVPQFQPLHAKSDSKTTCCVWIPTREYCFRCNKTHCYVNINPVSCCQKQRWLQVGKATTTKKVYQVNLS